jgi:serine/threonine protein kinase
MECAKAVHASNMIQFDLKPDNFLLCSTIEKENGDFKVSETTFLSIKLSDFGLTEKPQEEHTHTLRIGNFGTLKYMESAALHQPTEDGRKKSDKKIDVWSFDVMLFQLLHLGKS